MRRFVRNRGRSRNKGKGKCIRAKKIGQESALVVFEALRKLEEKKLIKRFNRKEAQGFIFIVFTRDNGTRLLCIKSSELGKKLWHQRHRRGPLRNAVCIVVHHHYPSLLTKKPKLFNELVDFTASLILQNLRSH